MTTPLFLLLVLLVLALVNVLWAAAVRRKDYTPAYYLGSRDGEEPAMGVLAGRLVRAQRNLYETLPLFAAAVLVAHVTGHEGTLAVTGAWLYAVGRLVYLPCYARGLAKPRSLAWTVALLGLLLVMAASVVT